MSVAITTEDIVRHAQLKIACALNQAHGWLGKARQNPGADRNKAYSHAIDRLNDETSAAAFALSSLCATFGDYAAEKQITDAANEFWEALVPIRRECRLAELSVETAAFCRTQWALKAAAQQVPA